MELTRRQKVLVWDDEVEVADETIMEIFNPPLTASPKPSVRTLPILSPGPGHRRSRSTSNGDGKGFPPPMRRSTTDSGGASRPVPFVSKLPRVHPGTSGVTVLEHMERVDAVEAGLRRLAMEDSVIVEEDEEDEEGDMGVSTSAKQPLLVQTSTSNGSDGLGNQGPPSTPLHSPGSQPDVHSMLLGTQSLASSMTEEDLVAMTKSTPALDPPAPPMHGRWPSHEGQAGRQQTMDWIPTDEGELKKRVMITEVCFQRVVSSTSC